MKAALIEEQAVKIAAFNGIDVYRVNSLKFKTNSINVFFIDNLSRENAAKNALLPAVLRRGCRRLPTFRDIALYLEELYGASFDCGVAKKGEQHVIQFYIDFLADTYAQKDGSQFEKGFGLLYEILTEPVMEDGNFKSDYLAQEKENLQKLIQSRVNDKMSYSLERTFEEMCSTEPFGVYEYGTVQDVEIINAEALGRHYIDMLENFPMQVYLAGDMDEKMTDRALEMLKTMRRGDIKRLIPAKTDKTVKEVREVIEKMQVNQGKLCLGFRTHISPASPDYYALLVCNGILGGGVHSKLFQNVREKASLAYYTHSRLEKFKGLMVISSGIETANKDKAMKIIEEQLEELKKGNITDYEYDATLKTIETGIKSLKDSQLQIVDFYLSQSVAGTSDTLDGIIEKIGKVTREDIVRVAAGIRLDTVYFLTM